MSGRRRTRPRLRPALVLRRFSQLVFLLLFGVLFIQTDYHGSDELDAAVNIIFRLDPFVAACVMLGVKALVALMLPALFVLLFTAVFGRLFCGWFCPMGTLLDLSRKVVSVRDQKNITFSPALGMGILVVCLIASLFGFSPVGYVDPFSLLVRGLAQGLYPAFNAVTVEFFTYTYHHMPEAVNALTEPVYGVLREYVLPSAQKYFQLAYFSVFVLMGIFLLERVQRRFFCRNICPLGAMLGFCGQKALLTGEGGNEECGSCRLCTKICRMGAIDDERSISTAKCNFCYECVQKCPRQIIGFKLEGRWSRPGAVSLDRRRFVLTACCGLLLPSVKNVIPLSEWPDPLLIRPPGSLAEPEFLKRCVRCAECLQVCIGNALQPAFLQGGLDGVFSPVLQARTGYCEFNCTLCGQVCPTGAIHVLTMAQKHRFKIGHAWFVKDLCLPYAKGIPCMVCEEHCPTPEKAIQFRTVDMVNDKGLQVTVKQPFVVDELCIGCGICENKCPLPGRAAIYVTSAGEERHPERALPETFVDMYKSG